MSPIWIILTIVAGALLLIFFGSRNAVWGGLTLGILAGLIAAGIYVFMGEGFRKTTVMKWAASFTLWGGFVEIGGRISDRKKSQS